MQQNDIVFLDFHRCRRNPVGCPESQCYMFCERGFQRDPETRCEICRCEEPLATPAPPSVCEPVRCLMACQYGWAKNETTGNVIPFTFSTAVSVTAVLIQSVRGSQKLHMVFKIQGVL